MTEREKQLWHGTSTGNYPPGTTASELDHAVAGQRA
jgi:hypothetical protein